MSWYTEMMLRKVNIGDLKIFSQQGLGAEFEILKNNNMIFEI